MLREVEDAARVAAERDDHREPLALVRLLEVLRRQVDERRVDHARAAADDLHGLHPPVHRGGSGGQSADPAHLLVTGGPFPRPPLRGTPPPAPAAAPPPPCHPPRRRPPPPPKIPPPAQKIGHPILPP